MIGQNNPVFGWFEKRQTEKEKLIAQNRMLEDVIESKDRELLRMDSYRLMLGQELEYTRAALEEAMERQHGNFLSDYLTLTHHGINVEVTETHSLELGELTYKINIPRQWMRTRNRIEYTPHMEPMLNRAAHEFAHGIMARLRKAIEAGV